MNAQTFEVVLARLYTDRHFCNAFLNNSEQALKEYVLTESERRDLVAIDRAGLIMASESFRRKRDRKHNHFSVLASKT